jgi:predicted dehydrogenase
MKQDVPADHWRSDAKNVPGGSGNLLGVHGIDLANALFGPPRRVTGSVRRLCARLPFEDTTAFTVEFDRGTAVITTSYVSQPLEHAYLLGTGGNAVYRDGGLLIEANRQATAVGDLPSASAVDCLLDQLVAGVREGRPVETGGESGVAAVAVVEAAIEAVKRGCSVELREEVAVCR